VAVKITGNARLFHDGVAAQVARVVVYTNQFRDPLLLASFTGR
jgi:hypothetical protein